jgi:hypothetical protein
MTPDPSLHPSWASTRDPCTWLLGYEGSTSFNHAFVRSLKFRLAPDQDDREFVTFIADRGQVRMIAKVARPVIEDAFPDADYVRDRLALVERNVDALARVVQEKVAVGDYRRSGDDIWVHIDPRDLVGLKLK